MYLYTEYCDALPLAEKINKLFVGRQQARDHLMNQVEQAEGIAWDDLVAFLEASPEQGTVIDDRVELFDSEGYTSYWLIEEIEPEESGKGEEGHE